MSCEAPEFAFDECDGINLEDEPSDALAWLVSAAILDAARCIIDAGPCPDGHKCDEGQWLSGMNAEGNDGVFVGFPRLDETCCCGSVIVGSRYLSPGGVVNECYQPTDLQFDLVVSWKCDTPNHLRLMERARLNRLLENLVCCKLPGMGNKNSKPLKPRLVDNDFVNNEPDGCAQQVFTFQLRANQ